MGSSVSTGSGKRSPAQDGHATPIDGNAIAHPTAAEMGAIKHLWEQQFSASAGELECISSGYTSFADYNEIGSTLRRMCRELKKEGNSGDANAGASSAYTHAAAIIAFFKVVAEFFPYMVTLMSGAPRYMVLERIMCNVAGLYRDASELHTSSRTLAKIAEKADENFQQSMEKIIPYLRACVRVIPISIIGNKNNYFACSQPILAPYVERNVIKNHKVDFFVSLDERMSMLSRSKSFHSGKDILLSIKFISSFISGLLSSFSLRVIFHLAREIRAKRKAVGDPVVVRGRTILKGLEKHALKLCNDYEQLASSFSKEVRSHYPHLFVNSDYLVHWSESEGRAPALTIIINTLLKMLFLFAGGSRSIAADDRRAGRQDTTLPTSASVRKIPSELKSKEDQEANATSKFVLPEDLALAAALRIEAIGWTTVIIKLFRSSSGVFEGNTSSDALICSNVLRTMYQFMGVLPFGPFCPVDMVRWMEIFPFYTLREEEMHTMLQLYCQCAEQATHVLRPINCTNVFESLIRSIHEKIPEIRKRPKTDAVSDLLVPGFDDDTTEVSEEVQWRRRCHLLYNLFAFECFSSSKLPLDITEFVKVEMRPKILKNLSPEEHLMLKNELSAARRQLYESKTGALIRWSSVDGSRSFHSGDALKLEVQPSESTGNSVSSTSPAPSAESNGTHETGGDGMASFFSRLRPTVPVLLKQSVLSTSEIALSKKEQDSSSSLDSSSKWNIIWACRVSEHDSIVIFDSEEHFPSDAVINSVKLLGHNTPIFVEQGNRNFAWTNPKYAFQREGSASRSIPFVLGWLLGSSVGNEVQLQIPMAPLVFRMMKCAAKFRDIDDWGITSGDLTLISQELHGKLSTLDEKRVEQVMEHVSDMQDPAGAKRILSSTLRRACDSLILNVRNDVDTSVAFWEEVVSGFGTTPLAQSPLLTTCCARVVRNVLCGRSLGNEYRKDGFRWEDHFIFICSPELGKLPYADALRSTVIQCLNEYFIGDQAQGVLLFFTGEPRLPPTPLTECLVLSFSEEVGITDPQQGIRILRANWPGHSILEMPSYLMSLAADSHQCCGSVSAGTSDMMNMPAAKQGGGGLKSGAFQDAFIRELRHDLTTLKPYPDMDRILQPPTEEKTSRAISISVLSVTKANLAGLTDAALQRMSVVSSHGPSTTWSSPHSTTHMTDEVGVARVGDARENDEKEPPTTFPVAGGGEESGFADSRDGTWREKELSKVDSSSSREEFDADGITEIISKPPRFALTKHS